MMVGGGRTLQKFASGAARSDHAAFSDKTMHFCLAKGRFLVSIKPIISTGLAVEMLELHVTPGAA